MAWLSIIEHAPGLEQKVELALNSLFVNLLSVSSDTSPRRNVSDCYR